MKNQKLNPWKNKLPFVKYISGARGSGKTNLLINLLVNKDLYLKHFDKIIFVCPSFYLDEKYSILDLPKEQIFITYEEETISNLIDDKPEDEQWLLILDDCLIFNNFKSTDATSLQNKIAVNGRHLKVSMIITSQKTTGGSTTVRSQADSVIIFKPRSHNEIDSLYNDNCINGYNRKDFGNLILQSTKEQYSFFTINFQNGKIFKNFEEIK